MTTLADTLATYTAENLPQDAGNRVRIAVQRAFMAGALAALTTKQQTREQLLAEIVLYGRTVGSAVERAAP